MNPSGSEESSWLVLNTPSGGANLSLAGEGYGFNHFTFSQYGWGLKLTNDTENTRVFSTFPTGKTLFGPYEVNAQNRLSVSGGLVVDQNDDNADNMFYNQQHTPISSDFSLGLQFGMASGEGIASPRADGALNQYGLDFYTGFAKRVSIKSNGFVGIGTENPGSALEVNGVIKAQGLMLPDGKLQITRSEPGGSRQHSRKRQLQKSDILPIR